MSSLPDEVAKEFGKKIYDAIKSDDRVLKQIETSDVPFEVVVNGFRVKVSNENGEIAIRVRIEHTKDIL